MSRAVTAPRSASRTIAAAAAPRPAVRDPYAACAAITRASGSNFVHLFRLLPAERRRGLEALYAFCRLVDDAADVRPGSDGALAEWRRELTRVLEGAPTHPVGIALADAVRRFAIPSEHLTDIVTGVAMDCERRRYESFGELERYCRLVAGAVGLATLPILGCQRDESRHYAVRLGLGLQLTNILRDLAEDAERGRVYLPQEDLRRFGYRERDLTTQVRSDAFRQLMAFECTRALRILDEARAAIGPERRALAAAEGMRLVYRRLLLRIQRRPEIVFGPRLTVSRPEKAACLVVALVASVLRSRL